MMNGLGKLQEALVIAALRCGLSGLSPVGKWLAGRLLKSHGTTVCPHLKNAFNRDFYETFEQRIASAEMGLWMTGAGIVGDCQEERELLYSLVEAQRDKLRKNQHFYVVRIQTSVQISKEWRRNVCGLLEEFPERFKLYFAPTQLAYACAIDPGTPNPCIEIMVPAQSAYYTKDEVAGFAVFVKDRPRLAQSLSDRMGELTSQAITYRQFSELSDSLRSVSAGSASSLSDTYRKILGAIVVEIRNVQELDNYLTLVHAD